jgi:hypothetical protein
MKLLRFIIVCVFCALIGAIMTLAATFPYKHKLEAENEELRVCNDYLVRGKVIKWHHSNKGCVVYYEFGSAGE